MDITFLSTSYEAERIGRLHRRGLTSHDRATCDAALAARIQARYRRGLGRRVAGRGVELDITGKSVGECVAALLSNIDAPRTGAP